MICSRAQFSASQIRKVYTAADRTRSLSARAECEAMRKRVELRRTGRVDLTSARAVSVGRTVTGHVRSLRDNRSKRAHSLGSCILATGVLPLPPLHCSCQGDQKLSQVISELSGFRAGSRFQYQEDIRALLRREPLISHAVTKRLLRGLNPFTRKPCEALT